MTQEHDADEREGMPFATTKIDVCSGIEGFREFAEKYPGFMFCPYLADKTDGGWAKSTSRVYMNQVPELHHLLYVPVNIGKDKEDDLAAFLGGVVNDQRVIAVNITQPHKSNQTIMRMFDAEQNGIENVDTLIRGENGEMHPYDLNASAFVGWYNQEVGTFKGKTVVMIGAGGAGAPIAQMVAPQKPDHIIIIDPSDKAQLVSKLRRDTNVFYATSLDQVTPEWLRGDLVVINAAGDAGMSPELVKLVRDHEDPKHVFVDIRPQLELDSVKVAVGLGWIGYSGHGMNAHNDHALACAIAEYMGQPLPEFKAFEALVAKAS